jgi:hypothetical protein
MILFYYFVFCRFVCYMDCVFLDFFLVFILFQNNLCSKFEESTLY